MVRCVVHRCSGSNEVDMGEAAYMREYRVNMTKEAGGEVELRSSPCDR